MNVGNVEVNEVTDVVVNSNITVSKKFKYLFPDDEMYASIVELLKVRKWDKVADHLISAKHR